LYNELASSYYAIILTQEAIEIYEENASVSSTIADNARNQLEKGIISETEYNLALINKKQIDAELSAYENTLEQYYIQLQIQLNTQDLILIQDSFDQFNFINRSDFKIHPQILVQEANLLSVESELKQTRALSYPTLNLFYQRSTTWATDDFFNFSEANELPQQVFGITLTLNPFNFSRKKKIEQSKINIELQKLELENSKLEIQKEDELLELQYTQGLASYEDDKQILELQQENDQHFENLYQTGMISLDYRLDKYRELLNSQNSYLNSLANLTLSNYKKYIRQVDFKSN
jgi:outer membrane protein TolC